MGSWSQSKEKTEASKKNEKEKEHDEHTVEPDGKLPGAKCSGAQHGACETGEEDRLQLQEAGVQAPGSDGRHKRKVRRGSQYDRLKVAPTHLPQGSPLPHTPALLSTSSTCLQGGLRGRLHPHLPHPPPSLPRPWNTSWSSSLRT